MYTLLFSEVYRIKTINNNYPVLNKLTNSSDYNLYIHCCCWRFGIDSLTS